MLLNNNLSGVSFVPQSDGLYAEYKVGADSVRKKLGSVHEVQVSIQLQHFDTGKIIHAFLIADGKNILHVATPNYGTGNFPDGNNFWYSNTKTLE